jgi:hypothetical protein
LSLWKAVPLLPVAVVALLPLAVVALLPLADDLLSLLVDWDFQRPQLAVDPLPL